MTTKVLGLRIAEEVALEIEAVARTNGLSISKAIAQAVEIYVADQRADPTFQDRLRKRLEEDRLLLERLTV